MDTWGTGNNSEKDTHHRKDREKPSRKDYVSKKEGQRHFGGSASGQLGPCPGRNEHNRRGAGQHTARRPPSEGIDIQSVGGARLPREGIIRTRGASTAGPPYQPSYMEGSRDPRGQRGLDSHLAPLTGGQDKAPKDQARRRCFQGCIHGRPLRPWQGQAPAGLR